MVGLGFVSVYPVVIKQLQKIGNKLTNLWKLRLWNLQNPWLTGILVRSGLLHLLIETLTVHLKMKDNAVKLAILLVIGTAIAPAWNLTIAELSDATDASLTTMLQLDLIIQAWGGAISDTALGILLYFTRNQPLKP